MSALNETDRIAVMTYVDGEMPPEDIAQFEPRLALEPATAWASAGSSARRGSNCAMSSGGISPST